MCPVCGAVLGSRDDLAEHSRRHSGGTAKINSSGAFPGIKMRHRSSLFINLEKTERIRLPPLSAYNDSYFDW